MCLEDQREVCVGQKSKYQYARISAAKLQGWGGVHQVGKKGVRWFGGMRKGRGVSCSSTLIILLKKLPQDTR